MKILKIKKCIKCTYNKYDPKEERIWPMWVCRKKRRLIYDLDIIPDWCPLEDAPKEFNNE